MTGAVVAAVGLLFAAIAAGCAAWVIREARANGREQHRATQQLQATVAALGEVLAQAIQLVDLEGQALRELRTVTREPRQAADEPGSHQRLAPSHPRCPPERGGGYSGGGAGGLIARKHLLQVGASACMATWRGRSRSLLAAFGLSGY
jgi:hypothetical protein